ncbi:MAG: hypothetical protein AAF555_01385 [Verrucomicrobiota bacterium]
MSLQFFDLPTAPVGCAPLTLTRPLSECLVGGKSLRAACESQAAGLQGGGPLFWPSTSWIARKDLEALWQQPNEAAVLRDALGEALAWRGGSQGGPTENGVALLASAGSFSLRYSWDLLALHEALLGAESSGGRIQGEVSPQAVVEGSLHLGKGSRLLPGVYLEGTVVIGEGCKIGPNCYLRGPTSIGDGCHIGNAVEIKNSILYPDTSVGHLSYVGDSIIGAGVNLGAGTITSNYRHDGGSHRSEIAGELIDTGRRKFGCILGDGVHTGIHTSLYPGRKLWPQVTTLPGEVVHRDKRGDA